MSNLSDWVKEELYPILFEKIDIALPELNFKRHGNKWMSTLKRDGSKPKTPSPDKTIVNSKVPGLIFEQGDKAISIVDYIINRDGLSFIDAVKSLADIVNLQFPKGDVNQVDYAKQKEKTTILEECNSYFIYCLENSSRAKATRDYLNARGYTKEDILAMELGYIPSQEKLYTYLQSKKYNQVLIDEIRLHKSIGEENCLSIPFRTNGNLKGFIFRTIAVGQTAKYINSTGLVRSETLFNIKPAKGEKDIVVVEGYLDALISEVRGVDNVVALGGVNLSTEQIKHAISKGARKFTLCLDNDKAGVEATLRAIEIILSEGVNRVYVVSLVTLKGIKTDPDSLIKERGVESFKQAIAGAIPYYEYKLQITLDKYRQIEEERGLQPKDIDNLMDEVVTTAARISEPTDKERFKTLFISLEAVKGMGITPESLSLTVDRITVTREKETQAKDLKQLLIDASKLQTEGKIEEALGKLETKIKEVKLKDKVSEFNSLFVPINELELKNRIRNKPESLYSGYTIQGERLDLPAGAISVLAAPTSHGKTTLLINTALNIAQKYADKEVYLFSYEEDGDSILMNTLNTYIDQELSYNNRRSIKSYFTTDSVEFIHRDYKDGFLPLKNRFFKDLVDTKRLNVSYCNYNSDTLIEAIRYLHKYANPGAIFIDYIQLLNLPEGKYKTYSRQEEIKEICIALKDIAVETGLPIILGAQFNREVVSHLRIHATKIGEAGDIERIANLIVGFWNNNFRPLAPEGELNEINNKCIFVPGTIYATILKNRGGVVGLEQLFDFNGNTGKIKNGSNSSNSSDLFK